MIPHGLKREKKGGLLKYLRRVSMKIQHFFITSVMINAQIFDFLFMQHKHMYLFLVLR